MAPSMSTLSDRVRQGARYVSGITSVQRDDFYLVSYPRSGNTWIRLFLCNLISVSEWGGAPVDFDVLNATMPELGVSDLREEWRHPTIPRVVKTHRAYSALLGRAPSIGVIRDPRDVMVSFFHFKRDRAGTFSGTFHDFVRDPRFGLESWFRHYASWRDRWILTLTYEDMRSDTTTQMSRLLQALSANVDADLLTDAVERSSFGRVRTAEALPSEGRSSGATFTRSGESGQWLHYFDDRDVAYHDKLADRFGMQVYR